MKTQALARLPASKKPEQTYSRHQQAQKISHHFHPSPQPTAYSIA
jgi:hypothetical protein